MPPTLPAWSSWKTESWFYSTRMLRCLTRRGRLLLRRPPRDLAHRPSSLTDVDTSYITGVVKLEDRILILLDTEVVLSEEAQVTLAKAAAAGSDTSAADESTASALAAIDA